MWPELDQLLRDENDVSGASATYTASIPEYRVVFYDHEDSILQKNKSISANGHASYDIQNPCPYVTMILWVCYNYLWQFHLCAHFMYFLCVEQMWL